MSKKYEDHAFTKLVKAIDAKWGHTYIDVKVEKKDDIEEMLKQIREMEAKQ